MSTRYNTGNQIESTDVRDMSDNAKNFDEFSLSTNDTFIDRFGVLRKTIEGAIRSSGIPIIGNFTTGCTVTDSNQGVQDVGGSVYRWKGALPKNVPPSSTPSGTGGISPSGDWVDIGDASAYARIINSLSYIDGAYLIGRASYDDIRSYTGPSNLIHVYGIDNVFDGAHGEFSLDISDTTSEDNGGTVLIDGLGRRWKRNLCGEIKSEWFGLRAGFVGDATQMLSNFFAAASGFDAAIAGEKFVVTSLLNIDTSNCNLSGVRGKTIISGGFGYAVAEIGEVTNLSIKGIKFENTYSNNTEDGYHSTVVSRNKNIKNLGFYGCSFTAPNCNGNGLSLYVNGLTTDNFTCDGLDIIDCEFVDIGRQACTLMNRSESANKKQLFKRVRFNGNRGIRLGLKGSYGMLLSLDGYGSDFEVDFNYVQDALGVGLEITKWSDGSMKYNQFAQGSLNTRFCPFGVEGNDIDVIGNKCITPVRDQSYLVNATGIKFRDNSLELSVDALSPRVMLIRSSTGIRGGCNTYNNATPVAGATGITFDSASGACFGNKLESETIVMGTATSVDCVRFIDADTTNNTVTGSFTKSYGGYASNTNSANKNIVAGDSNGVINGIGYKLYALPDSDVVATLEMYSADYLQLTGTLTAPRTITFPRVVNSWVIKNGTGQSLTMTTGSGSNVVVAAGKTAQVRCNGGGFDRTAAEF